MPISIPTTGTRAEKVATVIGFMESEPLFSLVPGYSDIFQEAWTTHLQNQLPEGYTATVYWDEAVGWRLRVDLPGG